MDLRSIKKTATLAAVMVTAQAFSQVGINTTSPEKLLHIEATGLTSEGISISNVGFSAQLLTETTAGIGNFILNNSLDAGIIDVRFDNVSHYNFTTSAVLPSVNAVDNIDGLDLGRFDRHYRRVYSQAIHTNDNTVDGGLGINIGSSGGTTSDYNFSDFAFYPVLSQVKDLGRNGNFWNNFFFVSAFTPSDRRLKKDIEPLSQGLETVLQMKLYEYDYTFDQEEKRHFGFMAQELQQLLPELVAVGDDKNETLSINYTEVIPILVKAMQEQQALIQEQASQLAQLQDRINKLD